MAETEDSTVKKVKRRGNPQNLKPFQKGVSGNPAGRPPTSKLDERIREFLMQQIRTNDGNQVQHLDLIMRGLLKRAAQGEPKAAALLLERGYGKVKQQIELEGGLAITHNNTEADKAVLQRYLEQTKQLPSK